MLFPISPSSDSVIRLDELLIAGDVFVKQFSIFGGRAYGALHKLTATNDI